MLARGAEKARDSPRRSLADVRDAMGVGPALSGARRAERIRSSLPAVRTADLELDLDVFAGPFDLLLAIVLREEISLLEVELGEIVLAYLDHLDEEGELDLEAATEFLVLIAALLELKSRLMLPAARRSRARPRARGGRRRAARSDARIPPLQGRRQPS